MPEFSQLFIFALVKSVTKYHVTKYPWTRRLNYQKFIFFQFCRLEAPDQDSKESDEALLLLLLLLLLCGTGV
jgi:hypothetical protein